MAKYMVRHADGTIQGPFGGSEIKKMAQDGRLGAETELRGEGTNWWHRARDIPAVAQLLRTPVPTPVEPPPQVEEHREPEIVEHATPEPPMRAALHASVGSVGAVARPVGFADRVLRAAFQFGRSISVLVIILSLLSIAGSVALGSYALMPAVPPTPPEVENPTYREFLVECARPADSTGFDTQGRSSGDLSDSGDECDQYRTSSNSIAKKLQLDLENFARVVCARIQRYPVRYRQPFIDGFRAVGDAFVAKPPSDQNCDGADAANWYMRSFDARIQDALSVESAAAAAAAERRALFLPALSGLGSAVAALLMFLLLPLMIQIERNTRAVQPSG